jgi:hypothetical protein
VQAAQLTSQLQAQRKGGRHTCTGSET